MYGVRSDVGLDWLQLAAKIFGEYRLQAIGGETTRVERDRVNALNERVTFKRLGFIVVERDDRSALRDHQDEAAALAHGNLQLARPLRFVGPASDHEIHLDVHRAISA